MCNGLPWGLWRWWLKQKMQQGERKKALHKARFSGCKNCSFTENLLLLWVKMPPFWYQQIGIASTCHCCLSYQNRAAYTSPEIDNWNVVTAVHPSQCILSISLEEAYAMTSGNHRSNSFCQACAIGSFLVDRYFKLHFTEDSGFRED
jgi:hypothetical protein